MSAKKHGSSTRLVTTALLAASGFLVGANLIHYGLAKRASLPVAAEPLDPKALSKLPLMINDWRGEEVPLDQRIAERTNSDTRINRRYSRQNGGEVVLVYVAAGTRARAMMFHRPEVCYVASGLTLTGSHSVNLELGNGRQLAARLLEFGTEDVQASGVVVLSYYYFGGQYYASRLPVLRAISRAWRGSALGAYLVQVQIVAFLAEQTSNVAKNLVVEFGEDSALSIGRFIADITAGRRTGELDGFSEAR